ncbi:MAG: FtsX-like permease family protein [Acidobacteriota bacterium]
MGKLILRNLLRNKMRTLLTLSSVSLALFLFTLGSAFLAAIESTEGTAANRVVVRHRVSLTFSLPEAYAQRLATLDHVTAVTPLQWFGGTYIDQKPENFFPRFGSDPDTLFDVFSDYQITPEVLDAWRADRSGFIAGRILAEKYGWEVGDRITVKGDIFPLDLDLVFSGIFEQPDAESQEKQLFFHRRYMEEAMGNPGIIGTYWLNLDAAENVPAVTRAAEEMFANSAAPVRAETEEAFALSFLEMLGNVRLLLGAIGLAIIISILFITANTMAMAARDRTREVAVLRTLGFQRGQVTSLVLFESLLVGVLGAVLGAGLGALLVSGFAKAMESVFPVFGTMQASPQILSIALAVGLAIGLLSGVVPAFAASGRSIVDGLRRVG